MIITGDGMKPQQQLTLSDTCLGECGLVQDVRNSDIGSSHYCIPPSLNGTRVPQIMWIIHTYMYHSHENTQKVELI